ncbi:MAG: alpha/beta hydrolase [Desulfurococcales archaeon]|nr:alpha/beta hydrolase [Desulfurococcales archaeon]
MKESLYGVGGVECRVIYEAGTRGPGVLFLHGYSFTGATWREVGVLDVAEELLLPYAAPDMPYGKRTECTKHSRSIDLNVTAARRVVERFLGGNAPLIVGASLGGRVALYYAARYPVSGLLLASPAISYDDDFWGPLRRPGYPVVILRGERDFVPRKVLRDLAERLGGEYREYKGAGHAMYLDRPEDFIEDFKQIVRMISSEKTVD